jgi:hypothetical protein
VRPARVQGRVVVLWVPARTSSLRAGFPRYSLCRPARARPQRGSVKVMVSWTKSSFKRSSHEKHRHSRRLRRQQSRSPHHPFGNRDHQRLARHTRGFKDSDGHRQTETELRRVTCFSGVGKCSPSMSPRGAIIMITSRIHFTRWTTAKARPAMAARSLPRRSTSWLRQRKPARENPKSCAQITPSTLDMLFQKPGSASADLCLSLLITAIQVVAKA